ncbi:VIER F-box protein 2 [Tanacetum coccineum]
MTGTKFDIEKFDGAGNKVLREVTEDTTAAGVWIKLAVLYIRKFYAKGDNGEGFIRDGRTYRRDSHQSRGESRSKYQGGRFKFYICQSNEHLKRNCLKNNRKKSICYIKKDDQPSFNAMGIGYCWVTIRSARSKVLPRGICHNIAVRQSLGKLNASFEEKDSLVQVWHKRLRHIREVGLQVLEKHELFGQKNLCKLVFYEIYVMGKSLQVGFYEDRHTTRGVRDYVHSDLRGPSQVESLGGYLKGVKGYKLYRLDDESPKIITSRNMVFNESVMYKDALKDSSAYADKSIEELHVEREKDTHKPLTYQEEVAYEYSSKWKAVMEEEMDSCRMLNTVYPLPSDTVYPALCPIQRIHPNRLIRLRMTKVIKGEFEKIKDVKVEDVSLTCDTPLEVFNKEKIDDDSEHEADDDMGYDPSDLTDEESSDDEDEIAKVFRIDTNIFNYETPLCSAFNEFNYLLKVDPDLLTKDIMGFKTYEYYKDDWIYKWNKDVPWVHDKPWLDNGIWKEPTPVKHTCKPFNYKTGCSEWPTCSWRDDRYCNGGNLPGTYIIGNQLHYQDYE